MPLAELTAVATVTGAGEAAKIGADKIRDTINEYGGISSLDAFEQSFTNKLEDYLINYIDDVDFPSDLLKSTLAIHKEDIFEPVGTNAVGSRNDVIDSVFNIMSEKLIEELQQTDAVSVDADELSQEELRDAIETAYDVAVKEFIESADDDTDRLQSGILMQLRDDMEEVRESLIRRPELFREVPFGRFYPQQDDQWRDRLRAELDIDDSAGLPFRVEERRERIADLDEEKMLLVGWKGAGKTRTLDEFAEPAVENGSFDEIIVIAKGGISNASELSPLAESQGEQDVLLLWDDIQKSDPEAIRHGLKQLEREFDKDNRSLYVRATLRQEEIGNILPENWGLDELRRQPDRGSQHEFWQEFTPVELEPLEEGDIRQIVTDALEYFDLSADEDTVDVFAEQVKKADPTPFYITTVCANTQGQLTEHKIRQLPDKAIDVWETAYRNLDSTEQTALQTLIIADIMDSTAGRKLLEMLYEDVFGQPRHAFDRGLEALKSAGWISTRRTSRRSTLPSKEVVTIHDVRLEAVASQYSVENDHMYVCDFLCQNDQFERRLIRRDKSRGARLTATYAEYVLENAIGSFSSEEARELFDRAIELNEDEPTVHLKYADALKRLGDPAEVIKQYEQACVYAEDPAVYRTATDYVERHDADLAEELYREGINATGNWTLYWRFAELMEDRDADRAEKIYQEGADATGHWKLYERFAEFINERDADRAEEIYREGVDATGDWRLYWGFARFMENRDADRSIEVYREGVNGTDHKILYQDFAGFIQERDADRAEKIYREGVDATGESKLYSDFAEFMQDRDADRAEKIYREGVDATGDPWLYMSFAEFMKRQDVDRAEEIYREGVDVTDNSQLYSDFAEFMKERDADRAKKIYREGVDATGDPWLYMNFAEFMEEQDADHAEKIYQEGVDATGHWRLYKGFAEFMEERDADHAKKIYQEGVDATGYFELYEGFAEFMEERDADRAEKIYQEGIDATGDSTLYREFAGFMEERDAARAEEIYREGVDATGFSGLYREFAEFMKERDAERAEKIYREGVDATGFSEVYREFAEFMEERDADRAEELYITGIEVAHHYFLKNELYKSYVRFIEERDINRAKDICQDGIEDTGSQELSELLTELNEKRKQ